MNAPAEHLEAFRSPTTRAVGPCGGDQAEEQIRLQS